MVNLYDAVNFSVLSLKDFQDKDLAYNVMNTIRMFGIDFFPTVYGVYEPLNRQCGQSDIDALVRMWMNEENATVNSQNEYAMGQLLMANRKKSKASYLVHWEKSQQERFNYFVLRVESSYLRTAVGFQKFMDLCKQFIILLEPVQGEIVNLGFPGWDAPVNLQVRYPELQWMSFFGEPYITLFGREKLLATPCHHVQTVGKNVIALQLGKDLFSPVDKEARRAVKEYLDLNAFVEENKSYRSYTSGTTPQFDFSEVFFDSAKPVIRQQIRTKK